MAEIALLPRRLAEWSGAPPRWYPLQLGECLELEPNADGRAATRAYLVPTPASVDSDRKPNTGCTKPQVTLSS